MGIGTSSPAYALDVSQTANASPVGLRVRNSEGSFTLRTNGGQTLMDGDTDILFRNSSETERMRKEAQDEKRDMQEQMAAKRRATARGGKRMLLSDTRLNPEEGIDESGNKLGG